MDIREVENWDNRAEAWEAVKDQPGELVYQKSSNDSVQRYRVIVNHRGKLFTWHVSLDVHAVEVCEWDLVKQHLGILTEKAKSYMALSSGALNAAKKIHGLVKNGCLVVQRFAEIIDKEMGGAKDA